MTQSKMGTVNSSKTLHHLNPSSWPPIDVVLTSLKGRDGLSVLPSFIPWHEMLWRCFTEHRATHMNFVSSLRCHTMNHQCDFCTVLDNVSVKTGGTHQVCPQGLVWHAPPHLLVQTDYRGCGNSHSRVKPLPFLQAVSPYAHRQYSGGLIMN